VPNTRRATRLYSDIGPLPCRPNSKVLDRKRQKSDASPAPARMLNSRPLPAAAGERAHCRSLSLDSFAPQRMTAAASANADFFGRPGVYVINGVGCVLCVKSIRLSLPDVRQASLSKTSFGMACERSPKGESLRYPHLFTR
jgi:hypothetical protein